MLLAIAAAWLEQAANNIWAKPAFAVAMIGFGLFFLARYHRMRVLMRWWRVLGWLGGRALLVGTRRKGWYDLLRTIGGVPTETLRFIWWRDRHQSPLSFFEINCPPRDLPFVVVIRDGMLHFIAVGDVLRPFRKGSPAAVLVDARAALDRVVNDAVAARTQP